MCLNAWLKFSSYLVSHLFQRKYIKPGGRQVGSMRQQYIFGLLLIFLYYLFTIPYLPFSTTLLSRFSCPLFSAYLLFAHGLHACIDLAS